MTENTWFRLGLTTTLLWGGGETAIASPEALNFQLPKVEAPVLHSESQAVQRVPAMEKAFANDSQRLPRSVETSLSFDPPPRPVDVVGANETAATLISVSAETSHGPGRLPVPKTLPPLSPSVATPVPPAPGQAPEVAVEHPPGMELFDGGSDSLVARAVGSAEGTRTPEGNRTAAYFGHIDPGNGVWNLGSFSYQHGAATPEEADAKQLKKLQAQAIQLRQLAAKKRLSLSPLEELNGIDLANQAPLAALDRGYIDWLSQAHQLGMPESEAILWARTRSFLDPDSGRWNAPGLGNRVQSVAADQERRMKAIARAWTVAASTTARSQEQLADLCRRGVERSASRCSERVLK